MLELHTFTFNPFSENTYIIFNENKNAIIIDPGNFHQKETSVLFDFIEKKQLNIKNILLTHAHIDHVWGLQEVYNKFKVPVLLHSIEQEILDRLPLDANRFGFQHDAFSGECVYINENETLNLDDTFFRVLHVPGHSPGSVAYYFEKESFVISGDVLFKGSIGRTDLYKGDSNQLMQSIINKLFSLPNNTTVFPGHGSSTTIEFEKNSNPFFI